MRMKDSRYQDTIAAIATPPGKGGIGIVRVSGLLVPEIIRSLFGRNLSPRKAELLPFKDADGAVLDKGIALFFKGPNSYTGEHVLELQGHGGPVVLNLVLQNVLCMGARLAKPGEFTERAFLNDKMDLAQAEAVIDLIESSSAQSAKAAAQSLQGEFSEAINELLKKLIDVRLHIEAALDFPEEEIDFLADEALHKKMRELNASIKGVLESARHGRLLKEGLSIVVMGQPNVGKSSLLNLLSGHDSAIVTEIAGTTRDVLREHIHIDGLPIHIIDTAGLRESDDVIEREGMKRAWLETERADRVLLVVDDRNGLSKTDRKYLAQLTNGIPVDIIHNKIDLTGVKPYITRGEDGCTHIGLSAKDKTGLEVLRKHLKTSVGYEQTTETGIIARQRHINAIRQVLDCLAAAEHHLLAGTGELAAEELKLAQNALSLITGEFSSDDLLGEIFSSFCIGK